MLDTTNHAVDQANHSFEQSFQGSGVDIDQMLIRERELARARDIQQANARKFLDAFSRGLAVTGFTRSDNEGTYLLEPWP